MSTTPHNAEAPGVPAYAPPVAARELIERLASQIDSAQSEIGETRAILKDAVERLMPAFTALRNSESATTAPGLDAADLPRAARAIRASGQAFSALQFQDISDQLLAHAQIRLVSLLAEVNGIAAALTTDFSAPNEFAELMQKVIAANCNLASLDNSLVKPVGKTHLGTGDMEFF
ncbi:MAG: hypothetical protein LH481_07380 [Burkholderiales bacterium]|nr:hypothetical protein [Burkholderiales bacterium]